MASEGNKAVLPDQPLSTEQPAISGAKRKLGRPRKYEHTGYEPPQRAQPIQSVPPLRSMLGNSNMQHEGSQINHTSAGRVDPKMRTFHVLPQQAQGQDFIIGKHFIGKMAKKSPGFSLITVKVKDNLVLKGWVPDENDLRPVTPKDDLALELPMIPPSQARNRASAIQSQAATPLPVHFKDVTLAKPLQMRRPVEKYIPKHTIPPVPRPYIGSGVAAAVPISVAAGNAESRPLPKEDPKPVSPGRPTAAVPIKSVSPVLISCKQVDNQDVLVEGNSATQIRKDSESSNGSRESSAKPQKLNNALVSVVVKESPGGSNLLNVTLADVVNKSSSQIQSADPTVMDGIEVASGQILSADPTIIDGIEVASDQIQGADPIVMDGIEVASGPIDHSNSLNSKEQDSKELSDNTQQFVPPKTETEILKEVSDSKIEATGTTPMTEASSATNKSSDHAQCVHDEHDMKIDSK